MTDVELFELSWYVRDHLFRRYNQEGTEIMSNNIPSEMIATYLRYSDANLEHVSQLTKVVLEELQKASVLVSVDSLKLKMNVTLKRFQCSKCRYVSYLSQVDPMKCFRCGSEEMHEFTGKRT